MIRATLFALMLLAAPAQACIGPAAPALAELAASSVPHETVQGDAMARMLAALNEHLDFAENPTRIVVLFGDTRAAIWLIVDTQICNILYGPVEAVREIVKAAQGQGV